MDQCNNEAFEYARELCQELVGHFLWLDKLSIAKRDSLKGRSSLGVTLSGKGQFDIGRDAEVEVLSLEIEKVRKLCCKKIDELKKQRIAVLADWKGTSGDNGYTVSDDVPGGDILLAIQRQGAVVGRKKEYEDSNGSHHTAFEVDGQKRISDYWAPIDQ